MRAAVARAIAFCGENHVRPSGVVTGGYVRTRNNIPYKVYADIARHVARELDKKSALCVK